MSIVEVLCHLSLVLGHSSFGHSLGIRISSFVISKLVLAALAGLLILRHARLIDPSGAGDGAADVRTISVGDGETLKALAASSTPATN